MPKYDESMNIPHFSPVPLPFILKKEDGMKKGIYGLVLAGLPVFGAGRPAPEKEAAQCIKSHGVHSRGTKVRPYPWANMNLRRYLVKSRSYLVPCDNNTPSASSI